MNFSVSLRPFLLRHGSAAALTLSSLLLLGSHPAAALTVQVNGTNYDLEIYSGSYNDQPAFFETPAQAGRMPWWGNSALAADFAYALAGGLSPTPLPADGPLFATAASGSTVLATYYDLSTLGSTDVIHEDIPFSKAGVQTYVVASNPASVPGPLPIFGAAAGWSFSRRVRRRLSSRPFPAQC